MDSALRFVDIIRRGYGRRYTWLPVDQLDRDGLAADFSGAYLRPDQIDIRIGDIARWREGEVYFQALVEQVRHDGPWLRISFGHVEHIGFEIYYS